MKRDSCEANVSAIQKKTQKQARFFGQNPQQGRTQSPLAPAPQGPQTPDASITTRLFVRFSDPSKNPKNKLSLGPQKKLQKTWEFTFIFENGLFIKGPQLNLWSYRDRDKKFGGDGPKIGVVVSRKVHTRATQRNLWKRRIREAFRRQQQSIHPETVMIFQARAAKNLKKTPSYQEIAEEMTALLKKAGAVS